MNEREFQTEAVKRAPLLAALYDQPMTLRELSETVSTSRSTIHRALGTFEEQDVVRKVDQRYVLTRFGRTVARQTRRFGTNIATARELDTFLNAVGGADVEVPLASFADAEVVRPRPHRAHEGVKRIIDLIESSDSLRMFSNVISPLYVDVARQEMVDGLELEVVFDERLVDPIGSEYAEEALQAHRTGRFDVHVAADVPFELFLYDGRMAMAAHDDSALPRMFVETETDAAVEWARELYRSYRSRATRFDFADLVPPEGADVTSPLQD